MPEAIFLLLVLVFLMAQPSTDRKLAKSRGKGKKEKRKGKNVSQKGGKPTSLGTLGILPKPQTSRFESRPPMSKKRPTETGATRGGPHHAPLLRSDQCLLCRQVGHRASECPNKRKATAFSPGKWAFGSCALGCALFDARLMVQLSKKPNKIKTRMTLKTLLRFQSRVWRGSPFLMKEPRRPILDS